jgi:DNA-binding LacI/PurR family transcriptional regulator
MWKAVADLKASGVLAADKGRAVSRKPSRGDAAALDAALPGRREKWRRLLARLKVDVVQGVYPAGTTLPSLKEMSGRYGVCYRTLRKALDELLREQVLSGFGKTCRVPGKPHVLHGATILLIVKGARRRQDALFLTPRSQDLFRALESECGRQQVRVRVVPYGDILSSLHRRQDIRKALGARAGLEGVLGLMLWPRGTRGREPWNLLQYLLPLQKRIAVLCETGELAGRSREVRGPHVRFFAMGYSRQAGQHVGNFLLSQGHRRIAYFSATIRQPYSRNRLVGLTQAFRSVGLGHAVNAFTCEAARPAGHSAQTQVAAAMRDVTAFLRSPQSRAAPEARRALARGIESSDLLMGMVSAGEWARHALTPMLSEAVATEGITAWVGDTDPIALTCLDYLRSRRRRVPQDTSVVGFDDTLAASFSGLTSYSFNASGVVQAMLTHILSPPERARTLTWSQTTEVDGFVNVRSTTAPRAAVFSGS